MNSVNGAKTYLTACAWGTGQADETVPDPPAGISTRATFTKSAFLLRSLRPLSLSPSATSLCGPLVSDRLIVPSCPCRRPHPSYIDLVAMP
jgi:hypothetical protein